MNFFKQLNAQLNTAITEAKQQLSSKIEFIPSGKGYNDDLTTTMLIQLLQIVALLPYNNALLSKYANMFGVDDNLFRAGLKLALGKHGNSPVQPDCNGLNEILAVLANHFDVAVVEVTLTEWQEHQQRMIAREQGL